MKFSVIVPVYNTEQYLEECIKSILSQSEKDLELILVDDGSTDNSPSICDFWAKKDTRVRVLHQKNEGLSGARNSGLNLAGGDYILFVDSDDWIAESALSFLYEKIQVKKVDIIIFGFQRSPEVTSDESNVRERLLEKQEILGLFEENRIEVSSACTRVCSAKIWKDIRFPLGKINEDEATAHYVLGAANRVLILPEKLYFYRENIDGIMHTIHKENSLDGLDALHDRVLYLHEREIETAAKRQAGYFFDLFWYRYIDYMPQNTEEKKRETEIYGKFMQILPFIEKNGAVKQIQVFFIEKAPQITKKLFFLFRRFFKN